MEERDYPQKLLEQVQKLESLPEWKGYLELVAFERQRVLELMLGCEKTEDYEFSKGYIARCDEELDILARAKELVEKQATPPRSVSE